MANEPEHTANQIFNTSIHISKHLLSKLLYDNTLERNISWQTNQYESLGEGYAVTDTIKVRFLTGIHNGVLLPRVCKSLEEQEQRSRDKAEVFTPSWVCNKQNNLIDDQWFGKQGTFNTETDNGWTSTPTAIQFPEGKTWRDYVSANRLEVSCGEAPYLTSRYDTVTGAYIPVMQRVGLLDRKLRVITENCGTPGEWKKWALTALKSIYGYDWQGDNVLLARQNLLNSVAEAFTYAFSILPCEQDLLEYAHIIAWNIWQMDGIKCVIPNSCHDIPDPKDQASQLSMFGYQEEGTKSQKMIQCEGCRTGNRLKHSGIYCRIMDWEKHKTIRFIDMVKEADK